MKILVFLWFVIHCAFPLLLAFLFCATLTGSGYSPVSWRVTFYCISYVFELSLLHVVDILALIFTKKNPSNIIKKSKSKFQNLKSQMKLCWKTVAPWCNRPRFDSGLNATCCILCFEIQDTSGTGRGQIQG